MSNFSQRRTVFMGTPEFAVPSLKALHTSGYPIVGVYTQPPRPKGRGHHVQVSPVHAYAHQEGLSIFTPSSLKSEDVQRELAALNPQFIVVAAYGLILPPAVLKIPPQGCINVHGSLLPRWRGAAPIQRAILEGDAQTGITIMEMEAGLDTGPMLSWEAVDISSRTTAEDLIETLSHLGASLLVSTLQKQENNQIIPQHQLDEGVTYAHKIRQEEGELNWTLSAAQLQRCVRALNPWPGTWFFWKGKRIKVLEAEGVSDISQGPVGIVLDDRLLIQCGTGALRPLKVMPEGGKAMTSDAFLRGHPIPPGASL